MKRDYSKWCSVALIAAIYALAGVAGWLLFSWLTTQNVQPIVALLLADVLATIVVWAFGLLYENVSVYDPYWSVFPPVAFLLWAFYTGVWSLPVILLLIASWYWGWRLTRNWAITFKGIAHEDWRYTKYRDRHPLVFHTINLFGLNMMPTLVVFAAMLPGLKLFETPFTLHLSPFNYCLLTIGFLVCLAAPTIQLIADKQSHDFRAAHPGKVCNVGLWKHGRHPNYFGEILFWWGIWILYASLNGIDMYIGGAIAMTALFLGISIPLMERRQLANKPEYAEYRKQTRKLIIFTLVAILFTACGQKKEVPFIEAYNYFVRNDVTTPVPTKIGSQEEFERYFGMAAFMGKNGQPTPIDFETQFAIAAVLPQTNHSTELQAGNLIDDREKLTFSYHIDVAPEENTWTQVPMLLIFVDRQYERDSVIIVKK